MMGAASLAVLFFALLVAAVIIGGGLFSYAGYCFLVVVNGTAAGADEVQWPDSPITDWAGKFFYFAWLISIGLVPTWLIVLLAVPDLLEGPLGILPLMAGVVWLIFPVLLLSALSANNPIMIFHLGLIRRLMRRPGSLAVFYFLTGPLLAGMVALGVIGFWQVKLLFVIVPAGAALFLMYARLIGRLAWLLGYHTPLRKPRGNKKLRGKPPPSEYAGPILANEFDDRTSKPMSADFSTASPSEKTGKDEGTNNPYGLEQSGSLDYAAETRKCFEPATASSSRDAEESERKSHIALEDASVEEGDGEPMAKPDHQSLLWMESRKPQAPPAFTFFTGVFTFPWYQRSMTAWIYLSLAGLLFSWVLLGMLATFPF